MLLPPVSAIVFILYSNLTLDMGSRVPLMETKRTLTIINQYFAPSDAATAVLISELVEDLASEYDVTVVCESAGAGSDQGAGGPPFRIVRKPIPSVIPEPWVVRSKGGRWLTSFLFLWRACVWLLFTKRSDLVVLASEPPFLDTISGLVCCVLRQPFIIVVQDLYPEFAKAVRLKPLCYLGAPLAWVHSYVCRKSSAVVSISEDHQETLALRGVASTSVIPNWTPSSVLNSRSQAQSNLPAEPFTVQYAGNLGLACDLDTLAGALEILQSERVLNHFRIVLRGHGVKAPQAERIASEYPQVLLEERVSPERVGESMRESHAHLILMPASLRGCVYPSKLYSIMAVARPVLASVPDSSHLKAFVEREGVGYVAQAGSSKACASMLKEALRDHRTNSSKLREMGERGYRFTHEKWTRRDAVMAYRKVVEGVFAHESK